MPPHEDPVRVLVVDDDPLAHAVVGDALADEAYALSNAEDWTSMSEVLFCEPPEVILLDVSLPGVDGDSIALILNETLVPRPQVILHSSKEENELRQLAERVDAASYLCKGCSDATMRAQVDAAALAFRQEVASIRARRSSIEARRDPSLPPPRPARRVLLAMPTGPVQAITQSRLISEGRPVTRADSWRVALAAAEDPEVGVILVDADLEGVSGPGFREALRRRGGPPPKVLLFSPVPPVEAQALARELRATGVISKQVAPDALVRILSSALPEA